MTGDGEGRPFGGPVALAPRDAGRTGRWHGQPVEELEQVDPRRVEAPDAKSQPVGRERVAMGPNSGLISSSPTQRVGISSTISRSGPLGIGSRSPWRASHAPKAATAPGSDARAAARSSPHVAQPGRSSAQAPNRP